MSFLKKLFAGRGPLDVRLQPSGAHFAVPSGETILERALKEGLAYPHDCTVGTCGASIGANRLMPSFAPGPSIFGLIR